MLLAVWKDPEGYMNNDLFDTHEDFFRATFSPECEIISAIELKVSGKDYQSRKEAAREVAKEIQYNDIGGLSYMELSDIQWFLLNIGKRYGLLNEFYDNGIL